MGSPRTVIVLIVAAVAAIALAVLVRGAFGHKPPPVQADVVDKRPMTQVLVAQRDLAIGERLAQGDIVWQPWPVSAVNANYITDGTAAAPQPTTAAGKAGQKVAETARAVAAGSQDPMAQLYGAIVKQPFAKGEPMVAGKIVRGGEGGYMSVVLASGQRAVAVPISVEKAAGGFVLPGDHVDVIQSREVNAGGGGGQGRSMTVADTLLRNVRVLAIDQKTTAEKNAQAMVGAVATLEVDPGGAELLARALSQGQGTLSLALRSVTDTAGPAQRSASDDGERGHVVRVFRGDQVSEVSAR